MSEAFTRAALSQRLAADPDASVFVTANAGSGKTKVLIDRVARLLLRGDDPSAFLCITYTKAAAAEMQRRLFERLGGWCVMEDGELTGELRALIGADAAISPTFLSRARALFAKALETPGGLKIQTIHSFCERLLRRFPLEAGAPPGFEVLDETRGEALMARAWAQIAARPEAAAALAHLARRLDEDRLDDLINAVNARRRVLRAAIQGRGLAGALDHLRARHGVERDRGAHLEDFFANAPWDDLGAARALLARSGAADAKVAARIEAARGAAGAARYDAYRAIFMTTGGTPRANVVTRKLRDANAFLDRLFADEMERVVASDAALRAIERAGDAAALVTLADALLEAYGAAKAAIGALDFEDLIERAEALLNTAGAAPWVLYKLDGGVDHILIDEGQDTSPAQWALLAPLQGEFFSGAGARVQPRTMFAVGDPKQSIYSFQGADAVRFLEQAETLEAQARAAGMAFHAPAMTMSFRSTPTVLGAVDAVFADLPLNTPVAGDDDAAPVAAPPRHDARRIDHVGLVEWWPLAQRAEKPESPAWDAPLDSETATSATAVMAEAIARRTAQWIRDGAQVWDRDGAPRAMRPGDVIALVRSRGGVFDALLKAFKSAGLPVAGADRMRLNDEIAVLDLLAFARVALDPSDDLSLACALKSPLIGLGDDDLMQLAPGRGRARLLDRLTAAPRYRDAARVVEAAIGARDASPHAFFARLLETPGPDGRCGWRAMFERLGPAARDPIEEVLARALVFGASEPMTLQHFVSRMEADDAEVKREMETGADAVRVMTVHGAKGLEAPVVILADTTGGFDGGGASGLMVAGEDEFFWSPNASGDDPATAAVRAATKEAARREHLRLLYVAMTRARDRLLICGHERGNVSGGRVAGCWHDLIETGLRRTAAAGCDTPFGPGLRLGDAAHAPFAAPAGATQAPAPSWIAAPAAATGAGPGAMAPSRLATRAPPAFFARGAERTRFRRGRLIHGLMQRLPDIVPAEREAAGRRWLAARMAPGEDGDVLIAEALAVLDDPRFAAAFGPASRPEAPLVGIVAGHRVSGIVDRLVVTSHDVLILDYKSDRPAPPEASGIASAYLAQLALYRALLTKAFPGRTIRCALLWTEAPRLMEAPPEALDAALDAVLAAAR